MFPIISKRFRRAFFYIGVHLVLWVCMFYTNSVEHILRKVDKMKSLKQIQSDFPEAKYFIPEGANEPDRSLVVDTSEKAQKLSERNSWYYNSLVETVPIELAKAASQLTKNRNEVFDLENIANWNPFAFEAAVKKVTACKVISIIESQVFVDERAEGLLINDVLVYEPIDGSLEGLKIYVPQIDAGINQPRNLESMINNIYPVYITDLKHRKTKTRKLSRMADKLYVALGSIQQGEFLRNMNLKLEFDELNETIQDAKNIIKKNTSMAEIRKAKRVLENAEKDLKVFTSEKRRGIVTNIGRNGVYLLSQNLETVYIAYSHLSFKSRSASLRPSDYINLKKRSEFPENELWDLSALYQDREDFLRSIEKTLEDINLFKRNYEENLTTLEDFTRALYEIEQIYIEMSHIDNYSFMPQTSGFSNEEFAQIAQAGADFFTKANVALSFFDTALATANLEILDALEENPHFSAAIRQAKIQKSHFISPEVEKALTNLGEVFKAPEDIYTKMRAGDFEMEDFEVDGKVYQNSFVTYENFYQNHENAQVREKAFRSFFCRTA